MPPSDNIPIDANRAVSNGEIGQLTQELSGPDLEHVKITKCHPISLFNASLNPASVLLCFPAHDPGYHSSVLDKGSPFPGPIRQRRAILSCMTSSSSAITDEHRFARTVLALLLHGHSEYATAQVEANALSNIWRRSLTITACPNSQRLSLIA